MGATGGTYSARGYFTELVKQFPPRLKQAIAGAAQHGLLTRGTWDGCVFNAAGSQVGADIQGYASAAGVFNVPSELVSEFISTWDNFPGNDVKANLTLLLSIREVGLFSEPTTGPLTALRGYVVKHVFKSELDALNEEFQAMAENIDITRPADQRSQLERDICELVAAL